MLARVGPGSHHLYDPQLEALDRPGLMQHQLLRLQALLEEVLPNNAFYTAKLGARVSINSLDDLRQLPFTTKAELAEDQAAQPPFGTNLTYALNHYVKVHQTSGTTGKAPIRWLDTDESWSWWARCWAHVYTGAGVGPGDRVFFAFSFGPFIGFWAAYEGARTVGALAIPGGGMQTEQRLQTLLELDATVLCCTPTYGLRLAEVARETGVDLANSPIRATIHAGEPGASVPSVRTRIEETYGARCFDHTGMTELGATGFTCEAQTGVHLIESEFIFEVIDPTTGEPVPAGSQGELVATNLGRAGMPLIRYRTGDLVQLEVDPCRCGRTFARMAGGILGRADDMLVVRGVNVFPSSIEGVLREFPEVAEFRVEVATRRSMAEVRVLLELAPNVAEGPLVAERVAERLHRRLLLRVPCELVPAGSLPRFELKARRVVRVGG
jgi:phenylacetate-CoA ligase